MGFRVSGFVFSVEYLDTSKEVLGALNYRWDGNFKGVAVRNLNEALNAMDPNPKPLDGPDPSVKPWK